MPETPPLREPDEEPVEPAEPEAEPDRIEDNGQPAEELPPSSEKVEDAVDNSDAT